MAFARTRMPRLTWVPAGVMTWPSLTTHEPFGCGPVTYVGYCTDWPAASAAELRPVASSPASGRRRLIREFFRELFRELFRDFFRIIYCSPFSNRRWGIQGCEYDHAPPQNCTFWSLNGLGGVLRSYDDAVKSPSYERTFVA